MLAEFVEDVSTAFQNKHFGEADELRNGIRSAMEEINPPGIYLLTARESRPFREGVVCDLDSLARSGSKIWNVARWTAGRIWDATGEIPDEGPLKSYMKNQPCWKDLNAQSSQAIIEELAGAFQS